MGRWKNHGGNSLNLSAPGEEIIASKLCEPIIPDQMSASAGELFAPSRGVRQSVDAIWRSWNQVYQKGKFSHRINAQNMRALFLSLQWCATRPGHLRKRVVHLVDSFVTLSIVCKGKTSSRMLLALIRQISAHVLAMHVSLFMGHVDSTENPADEGSRM